MFMCAEKTADGDFWFAVDSKETFNIVVGLSENGTDEASYWGGIEFDVEYDEDSYNGGLSEEDFNAFKETDVITLADAKAAAAKAEAVDTEDAFEAAYLGLREG